MRACTVLLIPPYLHWYVSVEGNELPGHAFLKRRLGGAMPLFLAVAGLGCGYLASRLPEIG